MHKSISVTETHNKKFLCGVQKQMGTRLRSMKKKVKGRGRLSDAMIGRFQNYYGIAIRSNTGDLKSMQRSI